VDEAIRLAQASGARLHIDHLHSTGGTFHMDAALAKIRAGIGQGLASPRASIPIRTGPPTSRPADSTRDGSSASVLGYNDLRVVGTGERLTAESFARYRKTSKLVAVPEGTMPLDRTVDRRSRKTSA
jgi:hypothetical protein